LAGTWDPSAIGEEQGKNADIYCEGKAGTLFGQGIKSKPSLRNQWYQLTQSGLGNQLS